MKYMYVLALLSVITTSLRSHEGRSCCASLRKCKEPGVMCTADCKPGVITKEGCTALADLKADGDKKTEN